MNSILRYLRFSKTKFCHPLAFSAFSAFRNKLSFEWLFCFWIGRWNGSSFRPLTSSETSNGELPRISLELYLIFNFNLSSGIFNRTIFSNMIARSARVKLRARLKLTGAWHETGPFSPFCRLRTPAMNEKHFKLHFNLIRRTKIIFNSSLCFSVNYFSVQFAEMKLKLLSRPICLIN